MFLVAMGGAAMMLVYRMALAFDNVDNQRLKHLSDISLILGVGAVGMGIMAIDVGILEPLGLLCLVYMFTFLDMALAAGFKR